MSHRRFDVDRAAHKGTCEWILVHKSYKSWLNKPHGLLWIKGNPGAGKSTVMAYLYRAYEKLKAKTNGIVISHFFHARGSSLQHTKIGMFRCLLHQLYKSSAAVRPAIRSAFEDYNDNLYVTQLQDLFTDAISQVSKLRRISIFIDALDKAGADVARELAEYLHELDHRLATEGRTAKICISCREYPVVVRNVRYDVWVNRENHKDIDSYTKYRLLSSTAIQMLNTLTQNDCEIFQRDIVQRASGIFQWASLAVGIVIHRSSGEGDSFASIQKRLSEVPPGLDELYKYILENLIDRQNRSETLLFMQLVAFAEKPLSVKELLYGMASDNELDFGTHEVVTHRKDPATAYRQMIAFINSRSGALIEVTIRDDPWNSLDSEVPFKEPRKTEFVSKIRTDFELLHKKPTKSGPIEIEIETKKTLTGIEAGKQIIQFIHESVRGYLLDHGLRFLHGTSSNDTTKTIIGNSHKRLFTLCIRYLSNPEIIIHANAQGPRTMNRRYLKRDSDKDSVTEKLFPFISFASRR
jgi:hypothetical protein